MPAASRTPRTGSALRASRVETACLRPCAAARYRFGVAGARHDAIERGECRDEFVPLLSVWYSAESRLRSPGKPTMPSASEIRFAHTDGACTPNRWVLRNSASADRRCARIVQPASPLSRAINVSSRSSVTTGSARLRNAPSSRARRAISASPPARNGERISRLACSKSISRPASWSASIAALTSGYEVSARPSEILNGSTRCAAAGSANPAP